MFVKYNLRIKQILKTIKSMEGTKEIVGRAEHSGLFGQARSDMVTVHPAVRKMERYRMAKQIPRLLSGWGYNLMADRDNRNLHPARLSFWPRGVDIENGRGFIYIVDWKRIDFWV